MTDHQVEKVLQKYVDLIMGKDVYMTPPRAGKCLNMQIRQSNLSKNAKEYLHLYRRRMNFANQ